MFRIHRELEAAQHYTDVDYLGKREWSWCGQRREQFCIFSQKARGGSHRNTVTLSPHLHVGPFI